MLQLLISMVDKILDFKLNAYILLKCPYDMMLCMYIVKEQVCTNLHVYCTLLLQ